MSLIRHLSFFLLYAAAAVAAAYALPQSAPELLLSPGLLWGAVVLLVGLMLHQMLATRSALRLAEADRTEVARALRDQSRELLRLRDEADAIRESMRDRQQDNGVSTVVAEVKLLQTLIERLYSSRGGAAGEGLAEPPALDGAASTNASAMGVSAPAPRAPAPVRRDFDERKILASVENALRDNRVELWVQPVVSLPQRKRRFFECYTRIPAGDGAMVLPEQYVGVAERSGMITAIDNILLFRCIQIVRKLYDRNMSAGFFCNISPRSLQDREFFKQFIALLAEHSAIASSIVFEFPQAAIERHDPELERDLEKLAALGFRFSVDQVTDFEFDAIELARRNFRYVKVDANRLIPPPLGVAEQDPEMVKRKLDVAGIDLIVEKVETDAMLVELLDIGIDYGQGYLFGEPRLSRLDF
ncbi:EAL domain-containing protein [Hypericibacter sp.]|uniref:EAL domain-containing protein n=1 Tax=Hypericibacter sp. TaxID=2705401 RepID=UPI003D6CDC01